MSSSPSSSPLNKIERAHQMYRDGRHQEALGFYTEALIMAKTKPQKIALHSNRAACYLKLHNFKKAAEECTLVLELDQNHTGALMLRAQTLVTLKEYHSALFDVNRLMELNPSSEVYQNLQVRLKTQLLLAPIPECEEESLLFAPEEEKEAEDEVKEEKEVQPQQQAVVAIANQKAEVLRSIPIPQAPVSSQTQSLKVLSDQQSKGSKELPKLSSQTQSIKEFTDPHSKGSKELPKPPTQTQSLKDLSAPHSKGSKELPKPPTQTQSLKDLSDPHSKGSKELPKPKGHSKWDYSRWDQVEDDSSEDEDEDEESIPQYRFRVRTVGIRSVK